MRTLAIGDIHGCLSSLEALADFVGINEDDTVITLGDYVDRGPDSKGVIDYLLTLRERTNLITLRGNHETMMLQARLDRGSLASWCAVGGDATLDSYDANSFDTIPDGHWKFLNGLKPYHETDTHFFVHANACPDLPLDDQPDHMLYWEFFDNPPKHQSGKTMVCGHSSQKSGLPKNFGHAICIDTFAHGGGWLTCLDVETGRYWQSNENGERRTA
jgi:serine/threonine protein phosphatase 1